MDVRETSNSVTLNILEIDVKSAKINGGPVSSTEHDEKRQEIKFTAAKELKQGTHATIEIDYVGILNDQMAGFYRSSYKDDNGNTKYLATTQFEATDARRAFPSFDEPLLKSVFEVTLIADKDLTTLANMLPKEEKLLHDGKKKAVTFHPTPKLSTYLVAFIVGDLRYVENNDYKIPVRVYTTPGLEQQGQFSAALAAKTLKFFANAFDIEYYLPHMNMVAIHDFSAGAMENLSLITYRTVDLLIDENTASLARKLRVSEVVQHELAHQWFGNLVTMKWWNDLWLNESYATYCSYMVFESENHGDESFIFQNFEADTLSSAFRLDGLRSSHPIEVPVKKAAEINQIFDAISYSKGSSLLRMIAHWLGKDTFLKGVSSYLKKHKFGNAETSDLWAALTEASGKDVLKVMDIWTKNVGYPVISVTENGNEITLKQNRFLSTGDVKPEEDKTLYPVFLNLKTDKGVVDHELRLETRERTITVQDPSFYKINADAYGFYRTLYTPERWTKLGEAGNKGLLSIQDRTHLVDDAFSLAVSGYHSSTNFLNLISNWTNENDYIVWDSILGSLGELRAVWKFQSDAADEALKKLTRKLISNKIKSLGWEFASSEAILDQRLKATLFAAAVSSNDPIVKNDIKSKFDKFVNGDAQAINPNIKASIFSAVARDGGEKEYDQILNIYHNPSSLDEKLLALRSLGVFKDEKLVARTLELALDTNTVKPQDIYIPLQGLRTHKAGVFALWKWLQANWSLLVERYPPSLNMLGNIVVLSTSGYLVKGAREEIGEFFKGKELTGFDKNLEQALDTLESKYGWLQRDGEKVADWLKENGYQ